MNVEVFSELLTINLIKLEKVSSFPRVKFEVCYPNFNSEELSYFMFGGFRPSTGEANKKTQSRQAESFQRAKCN